MENIEIHHWNKPSVTVVAYTTREAESLKKRGLSAENVRIVNAPLYRGVYQPCDASLERHKLGFTKDDFVATVHGIIDSRKGYDQLFEWWTKLVAIHPNWKLLVIGGAGNEQWCRKTIQKLRMEENIIMTGWLPSQSDVNRHLNAADCLLVTRKNTPENLGLIPSALFHNLAVGKPTVATALPGISEIISHGVNGYLYQPDSFESFKSLLEFISQNPEVAKKIAKTGRERAEECFSPEAAAVKYFALIRETFQRLSPKAGIAGFHDAMEKRRS
jgi:glycosyltransferase involved in cell wall biosynthesis